MVIISLYLRWAVPNTALSRVYYMYSVSSSFATRPQGPPCISRGPILHGNYTLAFSSRHALEEACRQEVEIHFMTS